MSDNIETQNAVVVRSRAAKLNDYLATSQHKSYFVGAVTVIFIGIFVIVGIVPIIRSIISQNEENKAISTELKKLNDKSIVMNNLIQESDSKASLLTIFNSVFTDQNSQELVIEEIYGLADSNNVFIKTLNFSSGRRDVPLSREFKVKDQTTNQKVNLNLDGSKNDILAFIRSLETSKRVYNLENIVITKKNGEALRNAVSGRDYDLSIVVEYFYWKDSQ